MHALLLPVGLIGVMILFGLICRWLQKVLGYDNTPEDDFP